MLNAAESVYLSTLRVTLCARKSVCDTYFEHCDVSNRKNMMQYKKKRSFYC